MTYRIRILTTFFVFLLLSGIVGTARAQDKKPTGPVFGHVDVAMVMSESKARKHDLDVLTEMQDGFRKVLGDLQNANVRFLSEAEIKELATLYEKPTKTDVDKKRIATLEDAASAKVERKRKLENTANPNEEQQQQFGQLRDSEEKGNAVLKGIADDYQKRFDARQVELSNKTVTDIKAIISKIAQEKGLSVVFDSAVAIWTANDITPDVIKQVSK